MSHHKSREVVLPIKMTPELHAALDALRETWRRDPAAVPRGLSCSQSKEGAFVVSAAESVFVTLPGACEHVAQRRLVGAGKSAGAGQHARAGSGPQGQSL